MSKKLLWSLFYQTNQKTITNLLTSRDSQMDAQLRDYILKSNYNFLEPRKLVIETTIIEWCGGHYAIGRIKFLLVATLYNSYRAIRSCVVCAYVISSSSSPMASSTLHTWVAILGHTARYCLNLICCWRLLPTLSRFFFVLLYSSLTRSLFISLSPSLYLFYNTLMNLSF